MLIAFGIVDGDSFNEFVTNCLPFQGKKLVPCSRGELKIDDLKVLGFSNTARSGNCP